jgi:uncharacterized phage protein (TIGR02218 family)
VVPSVPTLRFTDHNQDIVFEGNTFLSAGGFDASARETVDGLKDQSLSVKGVITSTAITEADIRAGRYQEAEVTEETVDWRWPWAGALQTQTYYIRDIKWNSDVWEAELTSLTSRLRSPVGRTYQKTCQWRLGEGQCGHSGDGVVLADFTDTGSVTVINTQKRVFESGLTVEPDNWYKYGLLTWTSGDNTGLAFEVRASRQTAGKMYLHISTPFDIQVGDGFNVYAGCDRKDATCISKFNNIVNNGAFAKMPLTDEMIRVPNVPRA